MKPRHVIYAVLATLVIFAAGVVTGGLLVRTVIPQKPAPPPGSGWQMARLDQLQRAVNQLDLTPEQRIRVSRIAHERQEYIAEMMRIIEPDLPGLFVKMRHDINQVLTPRQRDELDHLWAQIQTKRFGVRPGEIRPGEIRPGEMMGRPGGSNGQRRARPLQDRPPAGERQAPGAPPPRLE